MAMRKEVLLVAMMLALVVAAPGRARAACEVGKLTVCMPAITTGAKPSGACCANLRAQQACSTPRTPPSAATSGAPTPARPSSPAASPSPTARHQLA
ncbi:hypothetical protein CFC21_059908 [Triticum aestivum]|uniref:Bifunctional inhibitor/plant lipid transfer protein/seed storage helical domain-containing protein n=3 Tax=Triticum TaxID=4564 RepID=A0A9R0TF15_TRITD|nr:hypothetical protein CFC21_059908 [Triticum aestivum]VAI11706.1 unnamed protein product [Triticum turgidum subsp. durum]